jgi:hypothetical protein
MLLLLLRRRRLVPIAAGSIADLVACGAAAGGTAAVDGDLPSETHCCM